MVFERGERVKCPDGLGMVMYRRMKPPSYSEAESYSILLDSNQWKNYAGTIYPADQVSLAEEPASTD
jgi:hypothetical protein